MPGADALFTNININPDFSGILGQHMSYQFSRKDINNGLLPWDSILNGERQRPLPFSDKMDYLLVSPSLDTQVITRDELL